MIHAPAAADANTNIAARIRIAVSPFRTISHSRTIDAVSPLRLSGGAKRPSKPTARPPRVGAGPSQ
jgi:hypothetical protein